jgi:diaminopimelate epimerase
MTRTFHKMHGLGNDFAIFDAREEPLAMDEPLARAISDRRTGIGCDQLIVLEPSNVADLRMRIWNHDGIEVESCGNASRCVVALTHAKTIETGGGMVTGTEHGTDIEVTLASRISSGTRVPITYAMPTNPMPMAWGELQHPVALNVGNPHVVFFVENADASTSTSWAADRA